MGARRVMTAVQRLAGGSAPDAAERGNPPEHAAEAACGRCLPRPRRGIAIAAVLSAMAMVVLDGGLTNVALPTIGAALRVTPADAILVTTAYQVAVLMMLLPSAALGQRLGYRLVFSAGVAVFAAASLASAAAPSLPWLIGARFAQGLGGSAILALGVALLRFSVSEERLAPAIGWNAVAVALSSAVGPAIGALVIATADWRWLYVVNIVLGLAVMVAARALPSVQSREGRVDPVSISLNCVAFGAIAVAAHAASQSALWAAGMVLIGALAFAALVLRERTKSQPLIPLDLLRSTSFAVSVIASICCFTGQTAALVALPFLLQQELEQTPAMAALYMVVWPIGVALAAPFAGRIVRRVPTSWVCAIGGALLTTGLAGIVLWPLKDEPMFLAPITLICGAGFGLFQVANNRNMFLAAPTARSAAAGGLQGTARLTGQTAGALLVAQLFLLLPDSGGPQAAIALGAGFTLAAGVVSVLRMTTPSRKQE